MTGIDHHLIARVQRDCTGENVHALANALAIYRGYEGDETLRGQLRRSELEAQFRAFCVTGKLERVAA